MIQCPGCNLNEDKIELRKEEKFIILRCNNCKSIFSNIKKNGKNIQDVGNVQFSFFNKPRTWINRRTFQMAALWDISYLQKNLDLQEIKTVLDIGAQYGFLIREFTKRNIDALGIEAIKYQGTVTDKISYQFFDESFVSRKKYDLICLTHMIHYFPDTHKILKNCLEFVNSGGYLFITSNSPESSQIKYFVDRREFGPLVYLSKKQYQEFCKKNDLEIIDYSTFTSELFLTKVSLINKIRILSNFILSELKLAPAFKKNTDGERNYIIIKKK